MVFQRNSVKVGYNVQAASDAKNKLLIAADTGDVNDTKALAVMVGKAQENTAQKKMNVLADKGYHSGREIKACEELGATTSLHPKLLVLRKQIPGLLWEVFTAMKNKTPILVLQEKHLLLMAAGIIRSFFMEENPINLNITKPKPVGHVGLEVNVLQTNWGGSLNEPNTKSM